MIPFETDRSYAINVDFVNFRAIVTFLIVIHVGNPFTVLELLMNCAHEYEFR